MLLAIGIIAFIVFVDYVLVIASADTNGMREAEEKYFSGNDGKS